MKQGLHDQLHNTRAVFVFVSYAPNETDETTSMTTLLYRYWFRSRKERFPLQCGRGSLLKETPLHNIPWFFKILRVTSHFYDFSRSTILVKFLKFYSWWISDAEHKAVNWTQKRIKFTLKKRGKVYLEIFIFREKLIYARLIIIFLFGNPWMFLAAYVTMLTLWI